LDSSTVPKDTLYQRIYASVLTNVCITFLSGRNHHLTERFAAVNVQQIMQKNREVLIEGQLPTSVISQSE
jgi:hypothetical protein